MLIPHVVQTEADKVFVNIYNSQAVSVTDGDVVSWNTSSPDGVKTTAVTTNTLALFVGLADGTIAAGAYGLAQVYGYKATASVTNTTNTAIVAGDILVCAAGKDYLSRSAAGTTGVSGWVFAAAAVSTSTTPGLITAGGVFLRAM